MLPTSISEATISSAVITVRTIFRALVTCSICCEACWRSKMLLMIGEIGLRLAVRRPVGMIASRIAVQVGGIVGLDFEAGRQRVAC